MLIDASDETYDTPLTSAANEASRLVDLHLIPYEETLPLESPADIIPDITADFGASIFKRRMLPDEVKVQGQLAPDGTNILEAQGWFGLGISKLDKFIKNIYKKGEVIFCNPSGETGTLEVATTLNVNNYGWNGTTWVPIRVDQKGASYQHPGDYEELGPYDEEGNYE